MVWPTTLAINAWAGDGSVAGNVAAGALDWIYQTDQPHFQEYLGPPADPAAADWRDPGIGWGLVLPEKEGLTPRELASGSDAPEPIQELLRRRAPAPVFRYRPGSPNRFTLLRNYAAQKDVSIDPSTPAGIADDALPRYLLLYGTPEQIPWELQYVLNATCAVGRLDLTGDPLQNYVQALLNAWQGASAQVAQAVAWAVDFGPADITRLMRDAIAAKICGRWQQDASLQVTFFDGDSSGRASGATLIGALAEKKPGLIVTTSHGQTSAAGPPQALRETLGLLIDQDARMLDPAILLGAWEPDGAIWYAHACCSAGSDATTIFNGLLEAGSLIDQTLKRVAATGALVSPLPEALLGAKKPLRAFIGHVEPTFDWTLKQPATGQHLTAGLVRALYNNIYRAQPVGLAFSPYYLPLGTLSLQYEHSSQEMQPDATVHEIMLYCQLALRDLQSMVILGDPTVALPALP